MDQTARRKLLTTTHGEIEVSSDGRTVWVNLVVCLARFCPTSREYAQVDQKEAKCVGHGDRTPTPQDWDDFVREIEARWGITVEAEHTPLYIKSQQDVSTTGASPSP